MKPERQSLLFIDDEIDQNAPPKDNSLANPVARVTESIDDFHAAITALAPWFGSNRMLGPEVGRHLQGCDWVGIPFSGGMCEVPHITARTLVINDVHNAIITLGRVTSDEVLGPRLYRRLRRKLVHPAELQSAQERTHAIGEIAESTKDQISEDLLLSWAEQYFTAVWIARAGAAGTDHELDASLALRWNAGGGDSAKRYQNAIRSLNAWRRTLRRATFSTLDVFAFLDKCQDLPKHGIYCDQPFQALGTSTSTSSMKRKQLN